MADLYRVANWATHFECSQSRNLKNMTWVPIRVNLAGDGYTELLDHPAGAAHFGSWIALVELGALSEPRGTFMRGNGKPHDVESLSRITRIPVEIIKEAIPRLLNIGWLECDSVALKEEPVGILQNAVASQRKFVATDITDITDSTEQLSSEKTADRIAVWFADLFWPIYPRHDGKATALKAARSKAKTESLRTEIIAGLKRQLPELSAREKRFIPLASTWLNGERWHDDAGSPISTPGRSKPLTMIEQIIAEAEAQDE